MALTRKKVSNQTLSVRFFRFNVVSVESSPFFRNPSGRVKNDTFNFAVFPPTTFLFLIFYVIQEVNNENVFLS